MVRHIGIYGGGQLGLFLCRAAQKLGLETTVVATHAESPACAAADHVLCGGLDDLALTERLIERVDVITFELEAIPLRVIDRLAEAEAAGEVLVAPSPATLRLLQNKAKQKRWLVAQGLPTAPFEVLDGPPDAAILADRFGLPLVQKLQRGGYDGRGVQVIRTPGQLDALWPEPSLIETFLPEVSELAVLVARGRDGSLRSYAPVGLTFDTERNVLETAVAPARVEPAIARRARHIARRAIDRLEGIGLFAVEMFLTSEGTLLINEISPRVHNAGHHTLEACATSQFEQHLRAIAGRPLGRVDQRGAAVMRNLLWSPGLERFAGLAGVSASGGRREAAVYWYGKRGVRPWRKVGHITCLGHEADTAQRRTERLYRALAAPVQGAAS